MIAPPAHENDPMSINEASPAPRWTETPEGRFVSGYNIVQRLET
jgi:hypothetical protein